VGPEEPLVGRALRLRDEIGGGDVEHVLEMVEDAELGRDVLGVSARPVGEDQLAPRQPLDIAAADFVPKPERSTYERFLRTHGVEPTRAALFEDTRRSRRVGATRW
jgi:hypothetical protein